MSIVRIVDIKSEKTVYIYAFGEEGRLGLFKYDFGFYDLEINGIPKKVKCYKISSSYMNKFALLDDYLTCSGFFYYDSETGKLTPVISSHRTEDEGYTEPKRRKRTKSSPRKYKT